MAPSPKTIRVRPFERADLSGCLDVFRSNEGKFFDPHEAEEFEAFLRHPTIPYVVAIDNQGDVKGCGGYYTRNKTEARLCWGMVAHGLHHHGIGTMLLAHRLAKIQTLPNVIHVALDTSPESCGFFMRHRFNTCAVIPNGIAPGRDMVSMVLFTQSSPPQIHP